MKNIGILHLSDIHFDNDNKSDIKNLLEKLHNDLQNIQDKNNVELKFICITGDLFNRGIKSDNCQLFLDNFLIPLMQPLGKNFEDVFIVPGNHEINKDKINEYEEIGFNNKLNSIESIKNYVENNIDCARLNLFYEFWKKIFNQNIITNSNYYKTYIKEIEGIKFGIACLNSSWRSTGDGINERGKMIIGVTNIKKAFNDIKDTQIKICLIHHPLDWLIECEKLEIEKIINKFDLVLTGHIHMVDTKKIIGYQGKVLLSSAGKFLPTDNRYNGYSFISLNPLSASGTILLRKYFGSVRECFDKDLTLYDEGRFNFNLNRKNENSLDTAYDIISAIQEGFIEYANSFFVQNIITNNYEKKFEDSFVVPPLAKFSEYEKEAAYDTKDFSKFHISNELSIDDIINNQKNNLFILGRKGCGKTTLLNYIFIKYIKLFLNKGIIPVIIDCSEDFKGKSCIEKKCINFFNEHNSGSLSLSINNIVELLNNGKFVVLFDNIDALFGSNKRYNIENILQFLKKYSSNRFIFSAVETMNKENIENLINCWELEDSIFYVYIHSLKKTQIRCLANNFYPTSLNLNDNVLDKTLLCFKSLNLPRTPFIVSLILSLCIDDKEFAPINESTVMESFLEKLLEKNSKESYKTSTYDYKAKEHFLCALIKKMFYKKEFALSSEEFQNFVYNYHQNIGWICEDTKFNTLFHEKGILYNANNKVMFRYSCVAQYYLAKLALDDNEILDIILQDDNYLYFDIEINYMTGLKRNHTKIYNEIFTRYDSLYNEFKNELDELSNLGLEINYYLGDNKLNEIVLNRKSTEQIDLEDNNSLQKIYDSSEIVYDFDKISILNKKDKFFETLLIYATILKNSELLDNTQKTNSMKNIINGFCIILAMLITPINNKLNILQKEVKQDNLDENEFKQVKNKIALFNDLIKISYPLIVENIAFEKIGSTKLKTLLEKLIIENDKNDSFQMGILIFLYCDLRIKNCLDKMDNFIKKTTSSYLLTITLFKVIHYYMIHYFNKEYDKILLDLIRKINLKLHNNNENCIAKLKKYRLQNDMISKNDNTDNI